MFYIFINVCKSLIYILLCNVFLGVLKVNNEGGESLLYKVVYLIGVESCVVLWICGNFGDWGLKIIIVCM